MQYLVFLINKVKYAINTDKVKEVITNDISINKLPNTEDYVAGVTDLRGEVVEIINFSNFLNKSVNSEGNNVIITQMFNSTKGLIVDNVDKIVDNIELVRQDIPLAKSDDLIVAAFNDTKTHETILEFDLERFEKLQLENSDIM